MNRDVDLDFRRAAPLIQFFQELFDQPTIVARQVDAIHQLRPVPGVDIQRVRPVCTGKVAADFLRFRQRRGMFRAGT